MLQQQNDILMETSVQSADPGLTRSSASSRLLGLRVSNYAGGMNGSWESVMCCLHRADH
jgi:hypothetical protein